MALLLVCWVVRWRYAAGGLVCGRLGVRWSGCGCAGWGSGGVVFEADGLGRGVGRRIDRRVGWLFGGARRRTNPPGVDRRIDAATRRL